MRLLVAQGQIDTRELMVDILRGEGYEVFQARDGAQELAKPCLEHPGLILWSS